MNVFVLSSITPAFSLWFITSEWTCCFWQHGFLRLGQWLCVSGVDGDLPAVQLRPPEEQPSGSWTQHHLQIQRQGSLCICSFYWESVSSALMGHCGGNLPVFILCPVMSQFWQPFIPPDKQRCHSFCRPTWNWTEKPSGFLTKSSEVTPPVFVSCFLQKILMVLGVLKMNHPCLLIYWLQNYDSASAALDAYITDFERSRQNSESLTGRLVLPHSPPSTPSRPRVSMLRNKDGRSPHKSAVTEKQHRFLIWSPQVQLYSGISGLVWSDPLVLLLVSDLCTFMWTIKTNMNGNHVKIKAILSYKPVW